MSGSLTYRLSDVSKSLKVYETQLPAWGAVQESKEKMYVSCQEQLVHLIDAGYYYTFGCLISKFIIHGNTHPNVMSNDKK